MELEPELPEWLLPPHPTVVTSAASKAVKRKTRTVPPLLDVFRMNPWRQHVRYISAANERAHVTRRLHHHIGLMNQERSSALPMVLSGGYVRKIRPEQLLKIRQPGPFPRNRKNPA